MPFVITLSLLLTTLVMYRWEKLRKYRKKVKFPPGPTFYPLVGPLPSLWNLKNLTSSQASKWFKKKYGDIAGLLAINQTLIFMNDFNMIKEVLSSSRYTGRIPKHSITFKNYFNDNLGLIFSWGKPAKEIRSFTIKTLRKIKFGQNEKMNEILSRDVVQFTNEIDKCRETNGNSVRLLDCVAKSVFSNFWLFLNGNNYTVSEIERDKMISALFIQDQITELGKSIEWFLSFTRHFPLISDFSKLADAHKVIKDFFEKIFKQTRSKGSYRENPQNFIDYFMKEIDENQGQYYHDKQMHMVCNDLLIAGLVTTTNTIAWTCYHVMKNPRVYRKLMEEIDSVVGNRIPDLELDQPRMTYLQAVMQEGIRMDVAVSSISRMADDPHEINGYHIPANSLMVIDMDGLNKCPKLWGPDSGTFRPERFLDESMNLIRHSHFIPFGITKRSCLGEKIARTSLFFHLVVFFQKYNFMVPNEKVGHMNGISNNITPFDVYLTKRSDYDKFENYSDQNRSL